MPKFTIKTEIIEATQWFKDGDHPRVICGDGHEFGVMLTPRGPLTVSPGDWIIDSLDSCCDKKWFESRYEPVCKCKDNIVQELKR